MPIYVYARPIDIYHIVMQRLDTWVPIRGLYTVGIRMHVSYYTEVAIAWCNEDLLERTK